MIQEAKKSCRDYALWVCSGEPTGVESEEREPLEETAGVLPTVRFQQVHEGEGEGEHFRLKQSALPREHVESDVPAARPRDSREAGVKELLFG